MFATRRQWCSRSVKHQTIHLHGDIDTEVMVSQLGFTALAEIAMAVGGFEQPVFRVLTMPVGPHIISSVSFLPFPWRMVKRQEVYAAAHSPGWVPTAAER
jgi:hypothetical protein